MEYLNQWKLSYKKGEVHYNTLLDYITFQFAKTINSHQSFLIFLPNDKMPTNVS